MNIRLKAFAVAASLVLFTVGQTFAQNVLVNGSYEDGTPPLDWTVINGWSSSQVGGGTVVAGAAQNGSDFLQINAFGSGTKLLDQRWSASEGQFYETSAFMMTPAGANQFNPVNGQVLLIMQFYDAGGTKLGGNVQAPSFASGGPTTWTQFTTGSALAPGGTVTGRTIVVYLGSTDSTSAGQVYVDNVQSSVAGASTCGEIINFGFEDGPGGNCYFIDPTSNTNIPPPADDLPGWDWFGGDNAGFIQSTFKKSGAQSLAITFTENLAGQEFPASTGMSYIFEGYIYNPSTQPFTGDTAGRLLLEFADVTPSSTTVVLAVLSAPFLEGETQDTWLHFAVTGQAPTSVSGTLRARAFCAILGTDLVPLPGGALYFDDLCVTETTNTGGGVTTCGVIDAPGFEDTPAGTSLEGLNSFSSWTNFGIAGGVQDLIQRNGQNALQFFFTETLAGQFFPASPGERYTANGYALTPSSNPMGGTTNAQALAGLVILEYVDATATNVLASYASQPFTISTPQDVWTNLTILGNGLAPAGTVEGRVLVGVVGNETGFTGEVYFDDICATFVSSGLVSNCGELLNAGYDDGLGGNAYDLDLNGDFAGWRWFGGTNAGFVQGDIQRDGGQALGITYPENLAAQDIIVSTGSTFVFEGYIQNPSLVGTNVTTLDGPARGTLLMSFLDPLVTVTNISTNDVAPFDVITNIQPQTISAVEPLDVFTTNDAPDVWKYVSITGRAPNSVSSGAATLTSRVFSAILTTDNPTNFAGALFFDTLCLTEQPVSGPPLTQSGGIFNPGFEFTPAGTGLRYVDNWVNLGFDGAVLETPVARTGNNALNIFFSETLVQQDWPATAGNRYRSEGYALTEATARLSGSTNENLIALVIQQYVDSSGTVLSNFTSVSASFTTNSPVDTWVQLTAEGVAPIGTVTGRTLVGIVGLDAQYAGSVWFDDISQSLVSTPQPPCGLVVNGSFENGPAGNAYFIDPTSNTNIPLPPDDLPGWIYGGGDNAMFITADAAFEGAQSAVCTFPNNVLIQDFTAVAGETYTLSGRMFTPSGLDEFKSDGTSFGLYVLQFFEDGNTNLPINSTVSAPFAHTNAVDVWEAFQVTATAPNPVSGIVTGQVVAFIFSPDPGADFDLGGVIRFDDICVTLGSGGGSFEQWQIDNFGSSTAPGTGPQEDFDGDGANNENEFIAGTQPTNIASLFQPIATRNLPSTSDIVISWESAAGRSYDILRGTAVESTYTIIQTNVPATPPLNVYIDTPPASADTYYYRVSATTTAP